MFTLTRAIAALVIVVLVVLSGARLAARDFATFSVLLASAAAVARELLKR